MKLYQKLLFGFSCVALLVSCVGFVAQQMNNRVARSVSQLSEVSVSELGAAADMSSAIRESLAAARSTVHGSASEREAASERLEASFVSFEIALANARNATSLGRNRALEWGRGDLVERQERKLTWLDAVSTAAIDFRFAATEIAAPDQTRLAGQLALDAVLDPLAHTVLLPPLSQYREAARAGFTAEVQAVKENLGQADQFLFVAVLLGIGITLVLGILIANSISGPLLVLTEATKTLGRGRFEHRVQVSSQDEVSELARALNEMAEDLSQTTVSKQYLDTILTSMSDPLFVLNEHGNIILTNRAGAATLGRTEEQLLGLSVAVILAEGEASAQVILAQVRQWGGTGNVETRLLTCEGAELPVVFSAAAMRDDDGDMLGIVCVAKDITEQKLVERELVAARERAEEMARMKSSFLANMSHEIRTPLTGIIGSAQVLGDVAHGDALEMAHIIERAGVRLLSTINSVLDMARIEAGELCPTFEALPLAEEVRDAASVLRRLAEVKGLELLVIERTPGLWVYADVGFVHRIVVNLVGNAIKFTREGSVTVEIGPADEEEVLLTVRDTGIGMAAGFVPHLFEEFRQESSGIQRSHEGSGLGLAITKRLVELLDASIEVESQKDVGTTFRIRLARTTPERRRPLIPADPQLVLSA